MPLHPLGFMMCIVMMNVMMQNVPGLRLPRNNAWTESAKYAAQTRTVKIADDVFHTMDEYQCDLRLDGHDMEG